MWLFKNNNEAKWTKAFRNEHKITKYSLTKYVFELKKRQFKPISNRWKVLISFIGLDTKILIAIFNLINLKIVFII